MEIQLYDISFEMNGDSSLSYLPGVTKLFVILFFSTIILFLFFLVEYEGMKALS